MHSLTAITNDNGCDASSVHPILRALHQEYNDRDWLCCDASWPEVPVSVVDTSRRKQTILFLYLYVINNN